MAAIIHGGCPSPPAPNAVCRKAGCTLPGDTGFEYPPGTITGDRGCDPGRALNVVSGVNVTFRDTQAGRFN